MRFGENFLTYPDLFPGRPSGEPWGDERLMIRFAGHVYAWTGLSATQAGAARQRFGELCLPPDEEPAGALEINVFRAAAEDFCDGDRVWSFEFDLDYAPDAVSIAGFHFMGRLDWTPGLRAALSVDPKLSVLVVAKQGIEAPLVGEGGDVGVLLRNPAGAEDPPLTIGIPQG